MDLSKVAEVGDEGDPRAWSWSGAVYAASRGLLEMIEILKVKREFLYLLLTLTQEKNVKVSRFPLIHLDETIVAHTNLAEFHKFLQEKENEALLDRMAPRWNSRCRWRRPTPEPRLRTFPVVLLHSLSDSVHDADSRPFEAEKEF